MNGADKSDLKGIALEFLRMVIAGQVREAYGKHVAQNFRHHNPHFRGDAEALMAGMEQNHIQNPNKVLDVRRAVREGDFVAVHSHVMQSPSDRGVSVVHLFRFEGPRIAELWDVGQPVPETSPNANGMF
jgi:predicted SnoaL-like aldol condensation-catalyzing enzyme